MKMNEDLIMRLRLTNQFYPNADVSTEEVVAALESAQPAPQVPMTDAKIAAAWISSGNPLAMGAKFKDSDAVRDFVRAVESHHKIGVK